MSAMKRMRKSVTVLPFSSSQSVRGSVGGRSMGGILWIRLDQLTEIPLQWRVPGGTLRWTRWSLDRSRERWTGGDCHETNAEICDRSELVWKLKHVCWE